MVQEERKGVTDKYEVRLLSNLYYSDIAVSLTLVMKSRDTLEQTVIFCLSPLVFLFVARPMVLSRFDRAILLTTLPK